MSRQVCIATTHRLRALNGPLQGATFVVSGRLTIGRSCESDLQILQEGVSRRHAQIIAMPDGRHRVIDLRSSNGTFVDDRRIGECVLEPGMVLRIVRTRLVYEAIPRTELASDDSPTFVLRRVGGDSLRAPGHAAPADGGLEHDAVDLLAPARAGGETDETRASASASADGTADDDHERLVATLPDGSRYPGDLLEDLVAYRSLRTRKLRDDELEEQEEQRFRGLDERLRPPPDASGVRRYYRYGCHIPGFVRLLTGRTLPVIVENLGVDGAKVGVPWHRLETNTIAWLAIDVVRGRRSSMLVFPGRVVWWEREHLGLSFSGSPGWAQRGGRESWDPTYSRSLSAEAPHVSMRPAEPEPTRWLLPEEPVEP